MMIAITDTMAGLLLVFSSDFSASLTCSSCHARPRHEIYPRVVPTGVRARPDGTPCRYAADDGAWTGVAAPAVFLWTVRTTPDHRRSGTPDTGGTA